MGTVRHIVLCTGNQILIWENEMIGLMAGILLTTFVSVNGNVVAVNADSPEYIEATQNEVTDIGDPTQVAQVLSIDETESTLTTEESTTVSGGDSSPTVLYNDNTEEIALLSEAVELLAENSTSVTGTINTTVLELMDRIVDDYPSHYRYAGFRTDTDDSYASTLYIAKKAAVNGSTVTFSEDCIAINFNRYQQTGYSSYIYYSVTETPNAVLDINSQSIVYTNCIEGYPTLGNKTPVSYDWLYITLLIAILIITIARR